MFRLFPFFHRHINKIAKMITAAPATLLTTLPMMTGVGVSSSESVPELLSAVAVLVEDPPEPTAPFPPATNAPASVEVGSRDEVRE
jgi:hypothetical protein